jgi:putative transposase
MGTKIFYKRNLPHYQPSNATYFVTFRLANSLPKAVIEKLKKENEIAVNKLVKQPYRKSEKLYHQQKLYFGKFDALLDGSKKGSLWLKDDRIAKITADAIHYYDSKKYKLFAFCIMPNHVHVLFELLYEKEPQTYPVTKILTSIKVFTAGSSNKILHRNGQFWHRESYDHVVRNEKEFENIILYILQNPVKAGFVSDWRDWKWGYCSFA